MIISSDCHIGAPVAAYRDYLDPAFRDEFDDDVARRRENGRRRMDPIDDVPVDPVARTAYFYRKVDRNDFAPADLGTCPVRRPGRRRARPGPGRALRPQPRDRSASAVAEMETEGVVAEVLVADSTADNEIPFSGTGGGFGGIVSSFAPELQMAGQRAYNRWLADFCVPSRQIGIARVSTLDVVAAVRESGGPARPVSPASCSTARIRTCRRCATNTSTRSGRRAPRSTCRSISTPSPARPSSAARARRVVRSGGSSSASGRTGRCGP